MRASPSCILHASPHSASKSLIRRARRGIIRVASSLRFLRGKALPRSAIPSDFCQFVYLVFSFCCSTQSLALHPPAFVRGPDAVPSEDYSHWPP